MTQFNALASKFRIKTLLCRSAAVLLTACGGNIDAGGEQLPATAAGVTTDAGAAAAAAATVAAPAAAVEAIADPAPAASTEAGATGGATGQPANLTTQEFELAGYDNTPPQAQTGPQDAGANAPAPIRQ